LKLLYFSKTSFIGPSSRYRIYQYLPYLRKNGIEVTVAPLFGKGWFWILDLNFRSLRVILKTFYSLFRLVIRIKDILKVGKYDLYCFEHQAFPYLPVFLERIAKWINPNMLLEFDDAIFLTPFHSKKIQKLITMSKHVIAGNNFLKNYALQFNSHVTVIPTVIDTDRYNPKKGYRPHGKLNVGWMGLAYNLPYVKMLEETLKKLKKEVGDFKFTLICSKGVALDCVETFFKSWDFDDEIKDIMSLDIGIMPLIDDEWAQGKCGLKVLQYMACGVPVVASPVGVNNEIIKDGVNGFHAATQAEWLEKLSLLAHDEELRRSMGQKGRETVEKNYSLRIWAPRLASLYLSLI
jgi:glycosyltransferase involved in cell wall biosynthesis